MLGEPRAENGEDPKTFLEMQLKMENLKWVLKYEQSSWRGEGG